MKTDLIITGIILLITIGLMIFTVVSVGNSNNKNIGNCNKQGGVYIITDHGEFCIDKKAVIPLTK